MRYGWIEFEKWECDWMTIHFDVKNYDQQIEVWVEHCTTREFDGVRDVAGIEIDFITRESNGKGKKHLTFVMTKKQWSEFKKRINDFLK